MVPKPDKKIPALYGGIIIGLISSVPFLSFINCCCCAGILLGGFLAVMFYKNNFTPDTPPFTASDCMAVGILAGFTGAIVETALSIMFLALFGNVALEFLLNLAKNSNIQLPGDAMEKIEEALREGKSGAVMVRNFFGSLFINALFGMLGGLIGYSIFKPKGSPMTLPPMQAPPPSLPAS